MAKVGKAFGVAAETAGVATADIIGATFSTASGITKGVGKTAESAVNLVAHTTTGLSNVSENLSDTAAGYTARNKITQNSDTKIHSSIKNARTITEQKRIENELEQKKIKFEIEQEQKIAALSKQKTLSKQEQDENYIKIDVSYYYGFKSDSSPYEAGKSESSIYFSFDKVWYYYYYPIYYKGIKGDFHEITLPQKGIDGGRREKKITVHDNTDNKDIYIEFVRKEGKIYGDKMVPKITDAVTDVEIPITRLEFAKGWCYILKMNGGKRRGTNRRRRINKKIITNKRRRTQKSNKQR